MRHCTILKHTAASLRSLRERLKRNCGEKKKNQSQEDQVNRQYMNRKEVEIKYGIGRCESKKPDLRDKV